eukprot:3565046-Alexandrium_andersonii.AAC.1
MDKRLHSTTWHAEKSSGSWDSTRMACANHRAMTKRAAGAKSLTLGTMRSPTAQHHAARDRGTGAV